LDTLALPAEAAPEADLSAEKPVSIPVPGTGVV
jgi:hypothetical protein